MGERMVLCALRLAKRPVESRAASLGVWLASLPPFSTVTTASICWRAAEVLGALEAYGADLLNEPGIVTGNEWRGIARDGTLSGPVWTVDLETGGDL